jgi:DNA-binding XRE family transcriptional regulator
MQADCRNLYRNARKTAGLTQERWAEVLGLSVEAVRQYETGQILPSDHVALRMAEVAGQQIVCYWHLLNKSRVAAEILPAIDEKTLPEAVLGLMIQVNAFRADGLQALARIAADGKVDLEEVDDYNTALEQLHALISAALHLAFSKEAGA